MKWSGLDTRGVYRLVVPAYDPRGRITSLQARAVVGRAEMVNRRLFRQKRTGAIEEEKTRWPAGCASGGLFFADPWCGRKLLRGQAKPARVVLCEGVTDFCSTAQAFHGRTDIAVLGGCEGAWSAIGEVRWPEDVRLFIATDPDQKGDLFARKVAELVAPLPCYRIPLHHLRSAT